MVLGLTRPRTRLGGPVARSLDRTGQPYPPDRLWHTERGEILFEASCDVVGGFPGYAACGGHLEGRRLRVTERYLLVGDGDQFGFGLPVRDIHGVALVPFSQGEESGLRVFYQDGASARLFTIRFHGNRLALRGGPRAERAHLSLLRAGLIDRFAVSPPPDPDFIVPWEQIAEFETEKVIWAGRATVPREIGAEGVSGNVWLTTRSLIWGCESTVGVHRVPLVLVTDVAAASLANRTGTPVLYVGLGDETTGHFDLAFLFDQQSTSDHNQRERGALLVGLRSRGVPIGTPTPPFQPWRSATLSDADMPPDRLGAETSYAPGATQVPWPDAFDLPADDTAYPIWPQQPASVLDSSTSENALSPWTDSDRGESGSGEPNPALLDVVLAEWSVPPDDRGGRHDDVQVAASWLSPLPPMHAEDPTSTTSSPLLPAPVADDESPIEPAALNAGSEAVAPPEVERLPRVAAYESTTIGVLDEILAAIRDRGTGRVTRLAVSLPTAADQSAALAELTASNETGIVTPEEVRGRTARILALGDACVRLHTLVELRDAGHVTDADLARRQQTITAQLAEVMEVR
jgi:hypothetical protein